MDDYLYSSKSLEKFSPLTLPPPFNIVKVLYDASAKGSWLIVMIDSNLRIYLYKCPPYVRIQYDIHYTNHKVMTFIECSNFSKNKIGLIGVVLMKSGKGNQFLKMDVNVPIEGDGSICLCQGIFQNSDGEFCFLVHRIKDNLSSLCSLKEIFSITRDTVSLCRELFQNELTVYREKEVSILYLNQIGGPSHCDWNSHPRLFTENGLLFVESRLQPDSWCNQFINVATTEYPLMSCHQMTVRNGFRLKNRVNYRKSPSHPTVKLGMNKMHFHSQLPTDVFYCIPHERLITDNKNETIQLVELLTGSPYTVTAVPITQNQFQKFESKYKENNSISVKDHNSFLLDLMKENGMNVIELTILSPGRHDCTESYIISLLPKGSKLPIGDDISKVSSTINKRRMKSNKYGSFDVDHGCPIQFVYPWPYERIVSRRHVLLLKQCIPHCNSSRSVAKCTTGCYQNLGWRTTNQASGSMVSSPLNTKHQHHYHNGFNKSLLPFLSGLRNQLSTQAMRTCLHVGEPFLHCLLKTNQDVSTADEILRGSLITWGGFSNSIHVDKRDFMKESDSKAVESMLKDEKSILCDRLLDYYHRVFPNQLLPLSTTCCWCPVLTEEHDKFIHRQFFANLTCRISTNISSISFNEKVPQIGSTFFGGCFEHSSMRPLWLSDDGKVRITPPENSPDYWNFAWGKHG